MKPREMHVRIYDRRAHHGPVLEKTFRVHPDRHFQFNYEHLQVEFIFNSRTEQFYHYNFPELSQHLFGTWASEQAEPNVRASVEFMRGYDEAATAMIDAIDRKIMHLLGFMRARLAPDRGSKYIPGPDVSYHQDLVDTILKEWEEFKRSKNS